MFGEDVGGGPEVFGGEGRGVFGTAWGDGEEISTEGVDGARDGVLGTLSECEQDDDARHTDNDTETRYKSPGPIGIETPDGVEDMLSEGHGRARKIKKYSPFKLPALYSFTLPQPY